MILYTPLPPDLVLNGLEDRAEPAVEITMGHAILQVQPINPKQARIVRYISPNAQEYLDPRVAPGSIIEWDFRFKP